MHSISAVILTYNSEKYLADILKKLSLCCDEIVIVDSGSKDSTEKICKEFKCKFTFHAFENFKLQRTFALDSCMHQYVLMVDSDEVPGDDLIQAINELKKSEKLKDAYTIKREWYVLGKKIHAAYPVVSPDFPVRLINKNKSNFNHSPVVHEEPSGHETLAVLQGTLHHYTFETKKEIAEKLERYSTLSAQTLLSKGKNLNSMQELLSAVSAFVKWYFFKGGWRDGKTGMILGKYAFDYTSRKYQKARAMAKSK